MLYFRIPALSGVDALAAERGYQNRDEIRVSPEAMGEAYEAKVRQFFDEHLHEDEEIRYVRGGRGYFDVRDRGDRWVRIALEKVCWFLHFFLGGGGGGFGFLAFWGGWCGGAVVMVVVVVAMVVVVVGELGEGV